MQLNSTILEKAWLESTTDFQQRIPNPTQAGIAATAKALFDPLNNDLWNQFTGLMNQVAFTLVFEKRFENPFGEFKKERLITGNSVREIAPKWIKAHAWNLKDEDLLKLEKPEYVQWFQSINRQDKYKFTWNKAEMARAFAGDDGLYGDGYGVNRLIAATMTAMINSDAYDEYRICLNSFAEADKYWGNGLYKYQVAKPIDETTGKAFLAALETHVSLMQFPSERYNSLDVPVFASREEMVLVVEAEVEASVKVNTLATLFNLEQADARVRKVVVDSIPIDGVYAILTTVDFFEFRDAEYGIYTFFDPNTLNSHEFLHHWQSIGASPYVPCVAFTVNAGTGVETVKMSLTAIGLTANPATISEDDIAQGKTVQMKVALTGSVDPEGTSVELAPEACTWSASLTDGIINSRTYVDKYGVLHIQKSGVEAGEVITVTATSTYENPSGETKILTASAQVTVA